MLSQKCNGQIVHIGKSDEEIKISDLLKKLFVIAGWETEIDVHDAPNGCVTRRCPDTGKLYKLTGYKSEITLDEGLPEMFKWYMEKYKSMF